MLPTKFWAEMSWRDFAAADMSKVVAVLPVAAIEQHGPHLPVGVDTFINEGYLSRAVEPRARRYAGAVSADPGDRQVERAYRISGHADLLAGDDHARLDRNRRQRRAHGLPQADLHEFARRQRAGHRRGRARIARSPPHARRSRGLASPRLSRRHVFRQRARARHPRRRRRDFADARLQAPDRAHGATREFRERRGRDRAGVQAAARYATDRLRLDVERSARTGRGGRRLQRDRGEGRGLARKAAPTTSSISCATSWPSISRACVRGRLRASERGSRSAGPDFALERACMARGSRRIAGVDEVGRGPLAGPVGGRGRHSRSKQDSARARTIRKP